jgi:hypothetical protein
VQPRPEMPTAPQGQAGPRLEGRPARTRRHPLDSPQRPRPHHPANRLRTRPHPPRRLTTYAAGRARHPGRACQAASLLLSRAIPRRQ